MTDGQIILGGVVFTDFQIPNKIPFGGKQAHKIHDLIGGQRFVDAMGPNSGDKSWTGRFRGVWRSKTRKRSTPCASPAPLSI